jgi:hypothetical protein
MQRLVRAIENDLALRAIQSGLGANQWEQVASPELITALHKTPVVTPMQAREILRALGEQGQRILCASTLKMLLDLA